MEKINKKFYITTAIPYVNAAPHIGFAFLIIQADVLARWHRSKKEETFFLAGSDEHGVKIVRTAADQNLTPKKLADKNVIKFRNLLRVFNISNDDFIRTTDRKRHWPGANRAWLELVKSKDIYKKQYEGLYCVGHEAFITSKDIEKGICRDHKAKPEIIKEENYFFRLSKYTNPIVRAVKSGKFLIFPESRRNEILNVLSRGLEDVSFSRPSKDLKWGIPVPNDSTQTMYVWADALTNYISAIGYGSTQNVDISKFHKWWPADVEVLGKDNLRFHAAIWPGMLLSIGLPLPKSLWVHGFITSGGAKMSKTVGNVIDPFEAVNKYGADAIRYYLLKEVSYGEDGDFTYEKFEKRYNADLAKGLGNLVARVLTLAQKNKVKTVKNKIFAKELARVLKSLEKSVSSFRFSDAIFSIWQLISIGDKYIDDKKPWLLSSQSKEFKETIGSLLFLISEIGYLLSPFLPETSEKISKAVRNGKSITLFPKLP
ncbi:MAG: methionine--tRNA ligase [Patescibacteria group bacterium]